METIDDLFDIRTDIMEDDDRTYRLKEAINNLRRVEKTILWTYINEGTYTATAKEFNVSIPTARNYVLEIIKRLKEEIDDTTTIVD